MRLNVRKASFAADLAADTSKAGPTGRLAQLCRLTLLHRSSLVDIRKATLVLRRARHIWLRSRYLDVLDAQEVFATGGALVRCRCVVMYATIVIRVVVGLADTSALLVLPERRCLSHVNQRVFAACLRFCVMGRCESSTTR